MLKRTTWILLAILISGKAIADDIEVPEEELARETTLPVFNKRRAVLNRNVHTVERFEVGVGGGIEMNEPYYNDYMMTFQGTYNYSETSAINVQGLFWMPGLSTYGEQLKAGRDGPVSEGGFESFDAEKAPHPEWGVLVNYEYIAYYGKISLSKQTVMNLNLFGIAGLGYLNMGTENTIAANLGLGQNFFVTKNIGLRFDLRWLIFQGPNATTQKLRETDEPGSFGDRIYTNTQMGLSLVYIL